METFQSAPRPVRHDIRIVSMLAAAIALAVFLIDALTPLDIAIAVLYVIVVLLVASTGNRTATVSTAWGCVILTLVGFILSHDENVSGGALARCAVSLLAIGTTAILSLRNLATTTKMQEQLELLNLTHDAIVAHDMNDRVTFWNRGAEALYGFTAQEAIGQPIQRMTQSNSPVPHTQIHAELLRSGRWDGEITRVRHDGGEIVIASRAALLRDAKGLPHAVLATSNDITPRKRMEAELQCQRDALQRSEAFLLDAQRLSRTGSIATRLPAGTMWWSDEAYRIFDYPRDITPSIDAVLARTHPDDLEIVRGAHQAAEAGACDIEIEHRLLLPDGSVKHVHFVAHRALTESDGDEYVGALMDVTDTKRAQEALARSTAELAHVTRVTMLGELAASIAHEVTQPMAAIVTSGDAGLRWLNRPQPEIAEAQQSIAQMIRDAKRASEVIARIRAMARKRDSQLATLDVNEIVGETIELVRRELDRHRVDVRTELAAPSPTVRCDRVQLQQVLINLIMNAAQAMSGVHGPRALRIVTGASASDAGYAQITVQDSGTGVSEENARRLFDAFFTTKAEGMGMGLSICRSIIEAHGGRIWAEAPEEGGARLCFVLPDNEGDDDEL
ncbi:MULTISPECIES: ATP-binding protein [unclassified Caballeronia]|uniref:PAS domain-containing sensor histidine kinase n=1 Tax=unclassified Caballeronia TaxID=2646786 RepID=UPI001F1BD99F|nr:MULTISPECIES: ATP-binding protein [unclassified Caballeronia]MCE4545927.1 PAS domain S-box protein [Caballeronia sp. PC1]MCE4571951.1 PAS domain S-box protein [Caballeronia sp. CLC5]